jgi:ferredoxin
MEYNRHVDNSELRKTAKELGFAEAYFLPPPDLSRHEDEPHIVWNTEGLPWAKVSLLLVWSYAPYPQNCRIPSYYISSNESYHASVALARYLESEGVPCLRAELPIKQLAVRYGIGSACKSSLVSIPPYGTRVVFQSMLLGSTAEHPFRIEEYSVSEPDLCRTCRACENACPAHAIGEGGLDVKKCMRYYMDGADYPDWVYSIQRTHMGCEVCQQVCPRNAHIKPTEPPAEVLEAFDLQRLSSGDAKAARLLVGKNMTGRGKLTKEALNFLEREPKE